MALTTSMLTGLTGLTANSTYLDVVGNNIANVNTTGFKKSRVNFETQIARTLASGSAPTAQLGGTNPAQVGLGTKVGAIQQDFASGPLQPTGVASDMALDGNGFFIVSSGGSTYYTRAGNFNLDRDYKLTSASGGLVQGYGVDDQYQVVSGVLQDITIPLGVMTIAEPTREVKFAGNLNAGGEVATLGSVLESAPLFADAAGTVPADENTPLTSLFNAAGDALFASGDLISLQGGTRGGVNLPTMSFEVGTNTQNADATGTTMAEFMAFLTSHMGLDTSGGTAGVAITGGMLTIQGHPGEANDLKLEAGHIVVNRGTAPTAPFTWNKTQAANGESTRTTFIAYDSLGNQMNLSMTMVLANKDTTGTQWDFAIHSDDDSGLDTFLSHGSVSFDTSGQLLNVSDPAVMINRSGTGAEGLQSIDILFTDPYGSVTALSDVGSQVTAISQDGVPIGTLQDFEVMADGTVVGIFSNSLNRVLGRVPLATFANTSGLEWLGNSLYRATSNSGTAAVVTAGSAGAGKVVGRTLEMSNVELAEEFIHLITASTGFSANSRIISTGDRLMQELLSVIR